MINVKIFVEDQLGTSTLAIDEYVVQLLYDSGYQYIYFFILFLPICRNVTVRRGPIDNTTVSWLLGKVNDELNTLVRLNDPQQILDFSAAVITVLNSVSNVLTRPKLLGKVLFST